ncbi:hypothetical protein ANANG_G00203440 [Anguilla anguilla]|uniref:Uncharacterized protein n=1 Tax=Anguilla anguilla TaxID=7936 RepID=A0A9D3M029_ANGAN|nr:hypothetical protein ANANG_G00203440 [Anguilla anguilla]
MLEVALTVIDTWCKENRCDCGDYQANERTKDVRPNQVAEKVAARISENFSEAALIMVDNSRFTMECCEPILAIFEHHENKWKCRTQLCKISLVMCKHFLRMPLHFDME